MVVDGLPGTRATATAPACRDGVSLAPGLVDVDLLEQAPDPFLPVTAEAPDVQALIWWPEGDGY
jgi:hypothetical protein